jgi:hypothetical protein
MRINALVPIVLLSALVGVQTFAHKKELLWIKDIKWRYILGVRPGVYNYDIITALNIARTNRDNAYYSDKNIWIDIVSNLIWILTRLSDDKKK